MQTEVNIKDQNLEPKINQRKGKPVKIGNLLVGGKDFTVIAGPCSIESQNQFQETTRFVQGEGASILRGGIWKLRTHVKSFQGLGASAFDMIKEVKSGIGLPLCSEVTDARQIEFVDDVIDIYQVGSRNMHNYELLKELGKTNKPILLKRGFAALVDEWIKAADYIVHGGNENVILCERGIRTFETVTRNTLDLNAVVYLKENTDYPIIVDPSHAVGIRSLVSPLALASVAAGADGIIVEVHPRPEEALSDGMQALTFDDFHLLMNNIKSMLKVFGKELNH